MIDLIFILILTSLMWRCTTNSGIGDAIGCFVASTILYVVVKAPVILLVGGVSWPVSQDLSHHLGSGIVAFIVVGSLLIYTRKKKERIRGKENV